MTALDQAFIKAYTQQGVAPQAAPLSSAKPVCLAEALGEYCPEPAAKMPADRPASIAVEAVTRLLEAPSLEAAVATPAKSGGKSPNGANGPNGRAKDQRKAAGNAVAAAPSGSVSLPAGDCLRLAGAQGAPLSEVLGLPEIGVQPRMPSMEPSCALLRTEPSAAMKPAPPTLDLPVPAPRVPESVSSPSIVSPADREGPVSRQDDAKAPAPLRPLLEVDRFHWPQGSTRLNDDAGSQLDELAEGIAKECRQGRKAVAMSSCRRGDGCTTLTLAIAPRLAKMGLRVVLVDADFHNPLLARRLGLAPETGWEEALAGRLPLTEVMIESVEDQLALLPLREPVPGRTYDLGGQPDPAISLAALKEHYDLILLDLGRFGRTPRTATTLPLPDATWIDATVLIHNVRSTPQEDLKRTRRKIRDTGIVETGIVENFV
jgi:Mrp family chromosome partitioning ATPase